MEILLVVGFLIVGFYAGWHLHQVITFNKTKKIIEHIEKQLIEKDQETVVKIRIEKHDDVLYAYDFYTELFITQAKDRPELEIKLEEIFPGKKFGVTPENLKQIGFT